MLQGLAGAGKAGKAEVTLNRAEQPGQAGINTALELEWKHLCRGTAAFHRAGAAKIQCLEHRAVPVPPVPLATSIPDFPAGKSGSFPPGEAQLGSSMQQKHGSCAGDLVLVSCGWMDGAGQEHLEREESCECCTGRGSRESWGALDWEGP